MSSEVSSTPPSPDATSDPLPVVAARDGWWRRNRWWLAGALVSGALAFWLPYRDAVREFVHTREPSVPIPVRAGQWRDYEGSRWRVVRVQRFDQLADMTAGYPHSASSLVVVRYEVVRGRGVSIQDLDRCKGQLSDLRGRRWDADAIPYAKLARQHQRTPRTCGSGLGSGLEREQARPGRPFAFNHIYQVPAGVPTHALRSEIAFPPFMVEPKGAYLRFDLQ